MKILSAKLNPHTIHFFYHDDRSREKTEGQSDPDFPLFLRALGLFNFPETMVNSVFSNVSILISHFNYPFPLTSPYFFLFLFIFGLFCHAFSGQNSSENCHLEHLQRARPDFHGAQFHSQPGLTAATYADSAGHYGQTSRKNPGIHPRERHRGRLWRCEFVPSVVVGGGSSSRQTATPFGMGWAKEAVRIVHCCILLRWIASDSLL